MFACIDVHYHDQSAVAACILFQCWSAESPAREIISRIYTVTPYQPGRFYERELPCILSVLRKVTEPLTTVVIDGYVWLGTDKSPGLGAHLFRALDEQIPVIGVAKSRFKDSTYAYKAFRGYSKRPLYITAAGIDPEVATKNISHMHGKFRIPTLLKKVDFLCQSSKGVTPL